MTKSIGMIVAGDVGAKETKLALCGLDVGRPIVVVEETAPSGDFVGLGPMVQRFLHKFRPPQIRAAAFVVAGPVSGGVALDRGLPWPVGSQALASELGMDKVTILSDVEGIAHALPALAREDLVLLCGGDAPEGGNQVVLSVGASTGVAGLHWNGTEHRPFPSDGGDADFAPGSEAEHRLALHLASQGGRVTVERLLSRAGLGEIHAYLRASGHVDPPSVSDALLTEDAATVILRHGIAGPDGACRRALEWFVAICGSAASNLALTLRATGGVYLAGDLARALPGALASGAFAAAFGRTPPHPMLAPIPVHAVVNARAALLGAATVAARDLRTQRGSGWAS